jgi:ribulose-bisphosphate carboxylase large chain
MAGYEDFIHLKYKPKRDDLIASFKIKTPSWETRKRAAGAVAAESSVGTWSNVKAARYPGVQKVAAKVFEMKKDGWTKIAYPYNHFEAGNMSQILASIAGNVFGMKAVAGLRLEDIKWGKKMIKSFPGPHIGRDGIRKIFKVKKRPITLSVAKPKVGLTTKQHAKVGYEIWTGGLDLLKDDENLADQRFNPFRRRIKESLRMRSKAEKQTGEIKSYLANITGPTVEEMIKRAKFLAKEGNEFAMIDIVTIGWAAVRSVREACKDLGLAIHAHRAMHGAITRNPHHGISMTLMAEIARMQGVDTLHIGTANVGKLVGTEAEVLNIRDHVTLDKVKEDKKLHTLEEDWGGMKPLFPCTSGGLHPGLLEKVLNKIGSNVMIQMGGGCHGHPHGSHAGAKAVRQALDAYLDGVSADEYAKHHKELRQALEVWGHRCTK